jgi:hypothetical protein
VPLIFRADELLAAGDLILSEAARTLVTGLDAHIDWRAVQPGAVERHAAHTAGDDSTR